MKIAITIAALLLVGVGILNLGMSTQLTSTTQEKNQAQAEENRVPEIQTVTIVDTTCEECTQLETLNSAIGQLRVNITDAQQIEYTDEQAQKYIDQYGITTVPAIIISGELQKDSQVYDSLKQLGTESDEAIVVSSPPPFRDLASGEVQGKVLVTFLDDENCAECYDPTIHNQALMRFGVAQPETQTFDVNSREGKAYIDRYSITRVPTFVVEGDVEVYRSLIDIWPQVGRQDDSALIFDAGVDLTGGYRDLTTGVFTPIVEAKTAQPAYDNVSSADFQQLMSDDVTILDVRTPEEYAAGHIENALLIPVDELEDRLNELNPRKKILVYCHSGNRSAKASQILVDNGFTNVVNLEKGIVDWEQQGFTIVNE